MLAQCWMRFDVSTLMLRALSASAAVGALALLAVGCSSVKSNTLSTGMTSAQAVQAMGEPDLKDAIADPNHSGAAVQRYVWLEPGKAAIFGTDDRVANIQTIETNTQQKVEQQQHVEAAAQVNQAPQPFDPIETPLNYLFYPAKAATIYFGAGLNCATGAGCEKPQLPPPSAS
jgi:hypothetical protein